jgi:hypothetical protein
MASGRATASGRRGVADTLPIGASWIGSVDPNSSVRRSVMGSH